MTASSFDATKSERFQVKLYFGIALLIRLILIAYAEWHDAHMPVPYTDIDYVVYTDAARQMSNGQSPFDRTTYRYTPILAFMMLPNIYLHQAFGKILFTLTDIAIGWILFHMLTSKYHLTRAKAVQYTSVWLFHPFSINISSRGNADAVIGLLVLLTLHLMMHRQTFAGALVYGIAVHFRIYPIVYCLALLMFLNEDYGQQAKITVEKNERWIRRLLKVHQNRIYFTLVSAGTFFVLTGCCYYVYGFTFLYETYLYHFIRTDNRHNFSVYFYSLYLRYNTKSGFILGLSAFLPQILALLVVSWKFGRDLPMAFFLLTFIFVTFNKVCTAQYFVWYTSIVPLIVPFSKLSRGQYLMIILGWFGTELHWLYWAYQLEFKGENTFFQVFLAGLLFFIANIAIICSFIHNHVYHPIFSSSSA